LQEIYFLVKVVFSEIRNQIPFYSRESLLKINLISTGVGIIICPCLPAAGCGTGPEQV
jgi:hypothetical protein